MEQKAKLPNGLFIGIGLIFIGVMIYCAAISFKNADHKISVRGLSEREVKANMVLWPIVYTETGNDVQLIYDEIERKNIIIEKFLIDAGIDKTEILVNSASVVDLDADRYTNNERKLRYIATQVITINSAKVDEIIELQLKQNVLLRNNIAITTDNYQYPTSFIFTKLNDIKPDMIEQATKAARESAQKFAADSHSKIGNIINATQGQFSIEDRDIYTPQIKKVRVVTYIDYALN